MAKKVKDSKHHKEGADLITEQMFGEGAIRLEEVRMVVSGRHPEQIKGQKINKMLLMGCALTPLDILGDDDSNQMWECEVIIIPRKKFRKGFMGHRADQILADNFASEERWEEEIFSK